MVQILRFQPNKIERHPKPPRISQGGGGDIREESTYVYLQPDIQLAVNVALATKRPLLLSGPAGCGKSSLALNVALNLKRRYYEHVITSRSESVDILWKFDTIQRLNDAQVEGKDVGDLETYIKPGVLWWAFDPESARWRGEEEKINEEQMAVDPSGDYPAQDAVVLIDEIDKADPDLPNNLLVTLGALQFTVEPTDFMVSARKSPLVIITTNKERELPAAFIRRCVSLGLPAPTRENLVEIAKACVPEVCSDEEFIMRLADRVVAIAEENRDKYQRAPSTAEFLDAVTACHALKIDMSHADYERLIEITLNKKAISGDDE